MVSQDVAKKISTAVLMAFYGAWPVAKLNDTIFKILEVEKPDISSDEYAEISKQIQAL